MPPYRNGFSMISACKTLWHWLPVLLPLITLLLLLLFRPVVDAELSHKLVSVLGILLCFPAALLCWWPSLRFARRYRANWNGSRPNASTPADSNQDWEKLKISNLAILFWAILFLYFAITF